MNRRYECVNVDKGRVLVLLKFDTDPCIGLRRDLDDFKRTNLQTKKVKGNDSRTDVVSYTYEKPETK